MLATVGLLVLTGAGLGTRVLLRDDSCGSSVTSLSAAESRSPFLDAEGRRQQPDANRDALVAAFEADSSPYGEVMGAVGYHYEQWARLSSFTQGLGIRTRDNPDFTMLDNATLRPRWSAKVGTDASTWDASETRYLITTRPKSTAPEMVALDTRDGQRVWCADLGGPALSKTDALATQILDDDSVLVLRQGPGTDEHVTLLDAQDGHQRWTRSYAADEGDFLGGIGSGLVLAGGSAQFQLFDPELLAARPAGTSLVALATESGRRQWSYQTPAGSGVHVVGTDPSTGTAVLVQWTAGSSRGRLVALDRDGKEVWTATPPGTTYFDTALRAGRVLVRAGNEFSAYAMDTGKLLWKRTVPAQPQFLPYGFELSSVPLLDDDHVLMGTTSALRSLDLGDGKITALRLPTDGIATTYWPYQVALTPGLLAVATNTGTVVVRRRR